MGVARRVHGDDPRSGGDGGRVDDRDSDGGLLQLRLPAGEGDAAGVAASSAEVQGDVPRGGVGSVADVAVAGVHDPGRRLFGAERGHGRTTARGLEQRRLAATIDPRLHRRQGPGCPEAPGRLRFLRELVRDIERGRLDDGRDDVRSDSSGLGPRCRGGSTLRHWGPVEAGDAGLRDGAVCDQGHGKGRGDEGVLRGGAPTSGSRRGPRHC
mmetsp:Transcript_21986/g.70817  ORF Transcript_21986/g.70817 Transcript_21986/m.70817 type:complete len:211 (+) Transcript_21986:206-838(+)